MTQEYEHILVGSGIAATLIVDRLLAENPLASILILEAGGRIPSRDRRSWWNLVLDRHTPYEWTYDNEKGEDRESFSIGNTPWGFKGSRVRAYGGSTMHWGGWSLRYKEEDFQCRTNTGRGADWPFQYDTLEPWYALAEQELGVGGSNKNQDGPWRSGEFPLPEYPWSANETELAEKAFPAINLAPGHLPIARYKRCMTTGTCKYCPLGARYSAQDQLDELLFNPKHRNVVLKTNAPVRRILAERHRARGVEYFDSTTQDWSVVHGARVILCAGTYESTKLLLASSSPKWPNGLGNRYDQVGRYVVTHLMMRVEATKPENPDKLYQEYDFPTLMSRSWDTPERQAEGKVFVFNNRSLPRIDFERMMIEGKTREEIDAVASGPRKAGLHAFIEEFGDAENRLTLGKAQGAFNLPQTKVNFSRRSPPSFDKTVEKVKRELLRGLKAAGFVPPDDLSTENPRGDHASGTCRMGISPDTSVVDSNLAVHGIENLYISSNAVLPNAAAVNPTLTLAALSLRLGMHLALEGLR
ncbi:MAG: GMC family oxidoreductase [Gammaproteobacteria bacterium]|nr:GMC family oxidoreductase [Gammaproteobacteria bacterium]